MRCNNAVQKSPVAWEAFELGKRAGLFFASEAQANCKGLPAQPIETLEFSVRSQYPLNLLAGMNLEAPMPMEATGRIPSGTSRFRSLLIPLNRQRLFPTSRRMRSTDWRNLFLARSFTRPIRSW